MNYLELTRLLEGENIEDGGSFEEDDKLEEHVQEFREVYKAFSEVESRFGMTESYREFAKACPMVKKILGRSNEEEFYAEKSGMFIEGAPSKLVYLLKKASDMFDTPNRALSNIEVKALLPFLRKGALREGLCVKDVFENVVGRSVKLIKSSQLAVQNGTIYELYVPTNDSVCVLPLDFSLFLGSNDDLKLVEYRPSQGVGIRGVAYRTMLKDKLGIIEDDFDLRGIK